MKRIAIGLIKFSVDDGSGNSRGSFIIKVKTDTMKLTNMIVAWSGRGGNLI